MKLKELLKLVPAETWVHIYSHDENELLTDVLYSHVLPYLDCEVLEVSADIYLMIKIKVWLGGKNETKTYK